MCKQKFCRRCKTSKSSRDFYACNIGTKFEKICKQCILDYKNSIVIKRKVWGVRYLGGECSKCKIGYNDENLVIFDFHHKDKKTKKSSWSFMRYWSIKRIKKELDKCILLCSNCHRLTHARIPHSRKD